MRQKWKEWSENEDNLAVLTAWARAGYNDEDIAQKIGISRSTLSEWKKKHERIETALSTGKDFADMLVENSLFRMTQGFFVPVKKAIKVKKTEYSLDGRKTKEEEEIQIVDETEYIKPDVRAMMFWLQNRKEEWRRKITDIGGDDTGTGVVVLTPVQMQNIKKAVKKNAEAK